MIDVKLQRVLKCLLRMTRGTALKFELRRIRRRRLVGHVHDSARFCVQRLESYLAFCWQTNVHGASDNSTLTSTQSQQPEFLKNKIHYDLYLISFPIWLHGFHNTWINRFFRATVIFQLFDTGRNESRWSFRQIVVARLIDAILHLLKLLSLQERKEYKEIIQLDVLATNDIQVDIQNFYRYNIIQLATSHT